MVVVVPSYLKPSPFSIDIKPTGWGPAVLIPLPGSGSISGYPNSGPIPSPAVDIQEGSLSPVIDQIVDLATISGLSKMAARQGALTLPERLGLLLTALPCQASRGFIRIFWGVAREVQRSERARWIPGSDFK